MGSLFCKSKRSRKPAFEIPKDFDFKISGGEGSQNKNNGKISVKEISKKTEDTMRGNGNK